jgi:hypothetical protein
MPATARRVRCGGKTRPRKNSPRLNNAAEITVQRR